MKVLAAGGHGLENSLLEIFNGHSVTLVGSLYDPEKERFNIPAYQCQEFIQEFISHHYTEYARQSDILIDISGSLKSFYLMSDWAVEYGKAFAGLFYNDGWKFLLQSPGGGCAGCLGQYIKPAPQALIKNYTGGLEVLKEFMDNFSGSSWIIDLENDKRTALNMKMDCLSHTGRHVYSSGEMADVASVSCSDKTVAITPMNSVQLDLKEYTASLDGMLVKTQENPFFVQFDTGRQKILVFRQCRMVVKGTKEKQLGLYLYRRYLGS